MTQLISDKIGARLVSLNHTGNATFEAAIIALQKALEGRYFGMTCTFNSEELRDAFIAQFPKYVRVREGSMWGIEAGKALPMAFINFDANPSVAAGIKNEAGEKRILKFMSVLMALGDVQDLIEDEVKPIEVIQIDSVETFDCPCCGKSFQSRQGRYKHQRKNSCY